MENRGEELNMLIEMLFIEINDIAKLYRNIRCISSEFDCPEIQSDYLGKKYCKKIISKVCESFKETTSISYEGCTERIANEIYKLIIGKRSYKVIFTIDTYTIDAQDNHESVKTRMKVGIDETNTIDYYDCVLEKLKICLKDIIIRDWRKCIWVTDKQSETLCSELYPMFFKIENDLRAFVNKVLLYNGGVDFIEKNKNLTKDFKRISPRFSKVDCDFISMTLGEIIEIMKKKKDIFKVYLDVIVEYKPIENFNKNRNHIAHNKLLDKASARKIKRNALKVGRMISNANNAFEKSVPSDEVNMTIDAQEEAQRESKVEEDWDKNYIRYRTEEYTGVGILTVDGIRNKFNEKLDSLYTEICDEYYFSPLFSITEGCERDVDKQEQILFSVQSNAVKESKIEVVAKFFLDGSMDAESSAVIICRKINIKNKPLFNATMRYRNGAAHKDFDKDICLDSISELDDSKLDYFKSKLIKYIDDELNPMKKKIFMYYEGHNCSRPVSDETCYECDKKGVSIIDEFYPKGFCCFCGADNNN